VGGVFRLDQTLTVPSASVANTPHEEEAGIHATAQTMVARGPFAIF
jgi:hypothetical protein